MADVAEFCRSQGLSEDTPFDRILDHAIGNAALVAAFQDQVIQSLRESLQAALDNGWHRYDCRKARASAVECSCGWSKTKDRIEHALKATLDA